MASVTKKTTIPNAENVHLERCKSKNKNKLKKPKKGKREKKKTKIGLPDFLLRDAIDCYETVPFTQTHKIKRKKAKRNKDKLDKDFQLLPLDRKSKSKKQSKHRQSVSSSRIEDTQSVIYTVSPDQATIHSTESGCHTRVKEIDKVRSKKRVIFNLPHEPSQIKKPKEENFNAGCLYSSITTFPGTAYSGITSHGKQLVVESSLESQCTAEEMNSQDLFITQKSFLDQHADLSSSASGTDATVFTVSCNLKSDATTQTENFFTFPALSTSLRFQQSVSTCTEEPVDLSLPNRARQTQSISAKPPAVDSVNPPKLKTLDTSSEDSDTVSKSKGDLSQLKVIQTRLNESFFFKVKGDDSPKPICPLMKLTENVEKRPKK